MSLTLQFVRPLHRERVMKTIFNGMRPQGCLILVEKVLAEETLMNRLFIKYYYDLKRRNGYSDIEIAQKREALENVLIPYRLEENRQLLLGAGFRSTEVFFKWYNFCGILALT
jgi:tRNA (cmo5U34)-methyltransferase